VREWVRERERERERERANKNAFYETYNTYNIKHQFSISFCNKKGENVLTL